MAFLGGIFGGGGGGKKKKMPKQPNLKKGYAQGINLQLQYLPKQLKAEAQARRETDANRIEAQQQLQAKYGPIQGEQQLESLNKLAPGFTTAYKTAGAEAIRGATTPSAYESHALQDLKSGYNLPPALAQEVANTIRGRQAMSGNTEGNASVNAEAAFTGSAMNQMYQQRLQNAAQAEQLHTGRLTNLAGFLAGGSPINQIAGIAPVSPDRSFAYANPNAGYLGQQAQQQTFANQLGMAGIGGAGGGGSNPWGSILSTAAAVAPVVASAFGGSDRRLKKNINKIGETPSGLNIYRWTMKHNNAKMVGGMADDIEKKVPEAVHTDKSGLKMVDYARVDVPYYREA